MKFKVVLVFCIGLIFTIAMGDIVYWEFPTLPFADIIIDDIKSPGEWNGANVYTYGKADFDPDAAKYNNVRVYLVEGNDSLYIAWECDQPYFWVSELFFDLGHRADATLNSNYFGFHICQAMGNFTPVGGVWSFSGIAAVDGWHALPIPASGGITYHEIAISYRILGLSYGSKDTIWVSWCFLDRADYVSTFTAFDFNPPTNCESPATWTLRWVPTFTGWGESSNIEENKSNKELDLVVSNCSFNGKTSISFDLPEAANTSLKLYDLTGREIFYLPERNYSAGKHSVEINTKDFTTGIYFVSLETAGFVLNKKLIMIR